MPSPGRIDASKARSAELTQGATVPREAISRAIDLSRICHGASRARPYAPHAEDPPWKGELPARCGYDLRITGLPVTRVLPRVQTQPGKPTTRGISYVGNHPGP